MCKLKNECIQFKSNISKYTHYFALKTVHTYIETLAVNNDIYNIHVQYMKPDLYGIKVGCNCFLDTLCISYTLLLLLLLLLKLYANYEGITFFTLVVCLFTVIMGQM